MQPNSNSSNTSAHLNQTNPSFFVLLYVVLTLHQPLTLSQYKFVQLSKELFRCGNFKIGPPEIWHSFPLSAEMFFLMNPLPTPFTYLLRVSRVLRGEIPLLQSHNNNKVYWINIWCTQDEGAAACSHFVLGTVSGKCAERMNDFYWRIQYLDEEFRLLDSSIRYPQLAAQ